jgi:DNA repair protein RadA/Sms
MVDTVLYLEGSERAEYRLLRGIKNRFGGTAEVGVLAMTPGGLEDVANPSELFLSADVMRPGGNEGSAVAVVMEGSRPLLAEIQCLVSIQAPQAKFNTKRMSDGFPIQRLLLICAVIEKRLRLPLWSRDIYVNVAGGLRVSEPCSDLAVAVTVISSMTGAKIKPGTALIGELGLGGELRGGRGLEQRVAEARKMGFSRVVVPRSAGFKDRSQSQSEQGHGQGQDVFACRSLRDVLPLVFEDVDDVERLLKPSRRQRKWGMENYGADADAEAEAEAEAAFEDDNEEM